MGLGKMVLCKVTAGFTALNGLQYISRPIQISLRIHRSALFEYSRLE